MIEIRRSVLTGHKLRIHYAATDQASRWRTVDPTGLVTVRAERALFTRPAPKIPASPEEIPPHAGEGLHQGRSRTFGCLPDDRGALPPRRHHKATEAPPGGRRDRSRIGEWERIAHLLATTGGAYDPEADAIVQDESRRRSRGGDPDGDGAAGAVTTWASRHVPDLPLIARVRPANIASQRVAIGAGLARAEHFDGTGYDGLDWIYTAKRLN